MPTLDDTVAGGTDKNKQELQQALLDLLKENPDILSSVTQTVTKQGDHAVDNTADVPTRSGDEDDRRSQRSPSSSFPELENQLDQPSRASYQWQLSDSDDGIDSTWTATTKNMSPRELSKWRRSLFSVYAGHLPYDITKKELVQLFSECGSVQDAHLQPAREGGHTYGFIRYCTLDECRDAVSMLHGRLLGNRTMTVEFACETKERLRGEDPSDLPLDKKDKLLRNDYPKVDHLYRPMSDAESQEKMILWKLRCSATKQKSSPNEQESKEELMSKIQEIVKKVASLPADSHALSSGSEGSACSPWILKEINGNHVSEDISQSHSMQCTDKHEEQYKVSSYSENQLTDAPTIATVKHSPNMASIGNQNDLVQTQMLTKCQGQTLEMNTATFSSCVACSPFEDTLSSEVPCSPGRNDTSASEMETTASDSVSLSSLSPERPIRQHCQFCHGLSPAKGHASESGQSESTSSSSSRQSPASPCTFCQKGEESLCNQDDCPPLAEQDIDGNEYARQPLHANVKNKDGPQSGNHCRNMGLCSFDSGGDYITKNTDLYKEGQIQAHDSLEVHQPKQAFMPNQATNQEQTFVSNHSNRPLAYQGQMSDPPCAANTSLHKEGQKQMQHSSEIPELKQASIPSQYTNQEQMNVTNQTNRPFVQQGQMSDPPHAMNTDLYVHKEGQKQTHSSEIRQPKQASMPHQYNNQEQMGVTNKTNNAFVHQGQVSNPLHAMNTVLYKEGLKQTHLPAIPVLKQASMPSQCTNLEQMNITNQTNRPFAHQRQLSDPLHARNTDLHKEGLKQTHSSDIPELQQASMPSQYTNLEQTRVTNQSNRPFVDQEQVNNPLHAMNTDLHKEGQKQTHSSEIPVLQQASMPNQYNNQEQTHASNQTNRPFVHQGQLSDPLHAKNTDFHKEGQKQAHYSSEVPDPKQAYLPSQLSNQEQMHVANQANRPFPRQSLLNDPSFASLLGQPHHIQAMLANMMASGWQQRGFPRHPFLAPSVMNPGIFQGWNRNALVQQQLFASRMPFGSPFHAGGHQSRPRAGFGAQGPLPHQGRGHHKPFGQTDMRPMGRGRAFAPRFHNPGAENVKACGASEKGVSMAGSSEKSLPVDKNLIEACANKVEHGSLTANDSQKNSVRPLTNLTLSASRESEALKCSSAGSLEERNTNTSVPSEQSKKALTPDKYQSISHISEAANERRDGENGFHPTSTQGSTLPRQEGDLESPGSKKTSPVRMSKSEMLLKEEKSELKRIVRENERLRQLIDWKTSGGTADGVFTKERREALRAQIHLKEVQLQKEKEIIMARKAEQELLYEREKLEAAFDQQLKKELETEKRINETQNKIHLAKLETQLLRFYQDLHGTKQ